MFYFSVPFFYPNFSSLLSVIVWVMCQTDVVIQHCSQCFLYFLLDYHVAVMQHSLIGAAYVVLSFVLLLLTVLLLALLCFDAHNGTLFFHCCSLLRLIHLDYSLVVPLRTVKSYFINKL